jgi:hypothetical protein
MAAALLLALAASIGRAGDPATAEPSTAPAAIQAVQMQAQQATAQAVEIRDSTREQMVAADALRRFLEDKVREKEGKAPKGWEQPVLDAYKSPDAPESFIDATLPRQLPTEIQPAPAVEGPKVDEQPPQAAAAPSEE